jgi:hypothetical protein
MNTTIPRNPPPCALCGSSWEMHQKFPNGIRFPIPPLYVPQIFTVENEEIIMNDVSYDIMTCYEYVYDRTRTY